MRKASGFTIIELVVVITILGILAAVALPRFFDMQSDARRAAAQGVAGALASGAAMNYGQRLARGALGGGGNPPFVLNDCDTVQLGRVMIGGWPADMTVQAGGTLAATAANGDTGTCIIRHADADAGGNVTVTLIAVHD